MSVYQRLKNDCTSWTVITPAVMQEDGMENTELQVPVTGAGEKGDIFLQLQWIRLKILVSQTPGRSVLSHRRPNFYSFTVSNCQL